VNLALWRSKSASYFSGFLGSWRQEFVLRFELFLAARCFVVSWRHRVPVATSLSGCAVALRFVFGVAFGCVAALRFVVSGTFGCVVAILFVSNKAHQQA